MKNRRIIWISLLLSMVFAGALEAQKPVRKSAAVVNNNPLLNDYDVKFYGLDVEVDDESDYIQGNTTILVSIQKNQLSTLVFELYRSLDVERILMDGEEVQFTHEGDEIGSNGVSANLLWRSHRRRDGHGNRW